MRLITILILTSFKLTAAIPDNLALIEIATANLPLAFVSPYDGTERMFIVEQGGVIKVLESNQTPVFIDISAKIEASHADQGLLGMVFDPNYANNGYFYVNYTKLGGSYDMGITVVERYHAINSGNVVDLKSATTILEIDQYYHNHNGGTMHFGADGFLYIAMGDGGDREDPENFSQNLEELLGKMLRIDVNPDIIFKNNLEEVNACSKVVNYYIPDDNPFINDNESCDEIFFYGLRSPWKWSFDSQTHDFFIGDVGQASAEEISFIPATTSGGENLGWSCKEGNDVLIQERCPTDMNSLTNPIISYNHDVNNSGNSIVGGYRYRGSAIEELIGTYIYTDTISGDVWFAELINNIWQSTLWNQQLNFVVSFAEDEAGNIYTISYLGSIKKFIIEE